MEMPRAMMFIDGENLTMRYQDSLANGKTPRRGVQHEQDCFVWHPDMTTHATFNFIRIAYYTSVVGDDQKIISTKDKLSKIIWTCYPDQVTTMTGQIVPIVFKKPARSLKTRSVDIKIVIDIMRYAFSNSIALVYLVSGDGDYLPVIAEVMRHGTQVYVGALSSGLSSEIPHSVDEFFNFDRFFFEQPPVIATSTQQSS